MNDSSGVFNGSKLMSFKGCPNGCVDGYYVDPYKQKRILCQSCAEKRKSLVKQEFSIDGDNSALLKALNLPVSYIGLGDFSIDSVIPEFARKYLKPESLDSVGKAIEELVTKASVGVLPDYSVLVNFGAKAYDTNFIYALMVRAYISGLTVCPYISSYDICTMRNQDYHAQDNRLQYAELLKYDLCVVNIDAGAAYADIGAVKGLMQNRANKGKVTIIVTNYWSGLILELVGEEDCYSKNLAKLISVEYVEKAKATKEQKEVRRPAGNAGSLSAQDFNEMLRSRNNL